jgi:hypothetical protein
MQMPPKKNTLTLSYLTILLCEEEEEGLAIKILLCTKTAQMPFTFA